MNKKALFSILFFFPFLVLCQGWKEVYTLTSHTLAIKLDGSLWSWGSNYYGQLGQGNNISLIYPKQIGIERDWKSITIGDGFTVALKEDGTIWSWGLNDKGQLGIGDLNNKSTPTKIGNSADWISIHAGSKHVVALKNDGTIWVWGSNELGQLGIGNQINQLQPISQSSSKTWKKIEATNDYSYALNISGELFAWGQYSSNGSPDLYPKALFINKLFQNFYIGERVGYFEDVNGVLYGSGNDLYDLVSLNQNPNQDYPREFPCTEYDFQTISCSGHHALGITTNGYLYSWGLNSSGQLGNYSTTNKNYPFLVAYPNTWVKVAAGVEHSFAIDINHVLHACGKNVNGILGDSTIENRQYFIKIDCPETNYEPIILEDYTFFPNPVSSLFYFAFEKEKPVQNYTISNMEGDPTFATTNKQFDSHAGTIDFSAFKSGIYLIDFLVDNKHFQQKIVKL